VVLSVDKVADPGDGEPIIAAGRRIEHLQ